MVKPAHHKQKAEPIVIDVAKAAKTAERNRLAIVELVNAVEILCHTLKDPHNLLSNMVQKARDLTEN